MRTLVDASCLRAAHPTGVTNAVRSLLQTNAFGFTGEVELATYGWRPPSEAERHGLPYPWRHVRIPSKAMHALCGSGAFSFERLFQNVDRLFFPNLNIVGTPRLPYGLLIHDVSFLLRPQWFTWKTRLWHAAARPRSLISGADTLFVLSEWTRRDLIELLRVPEERITRVTLPTSKKRTAAAPRPVAEPYFLLFGASDKRKNAEVVRQAFAAFRQSHPDHRLVLAGNAEKKEGPGVISLGYLSPDERERWLAHAQALLYPSWYEGYGMPPHEASAFGVHTITAGNGAVAETAPPGVTLLPAHLPHLWQQALERHAAPYDPSSQAK